MGQVPHLTYGIVGDGRMARHMIHYFSLAGIPYQQWSRRQATNSPIQNFQSCDVILLLIKDSAIEPFVQSWLQLTQRKLIHFSGSLVTPLAEGFHPLMTFGSQLYDLSTYEQIPFVGSRNGSPFKKLFPHLKNPYYAIDPLEKPLYHALCVMSGNFTTLLWQNFFKTMESRFLIPRHAAVPYMLKTFENLLAAPDGALTGPIARKDLSTLKKDLLALEDHELRPVFLAFLQIYVPEIFNEPTSQTEVSP